MPAKAQQSNTEKHGYRVKNIVIDAGHGGKDPGASGKTFDEKDISLNISLKLGVAIKQFLPELNVFLTRNEDVYHDPRTKADIANRAKGDLFISIHANSAIKRIYLKPQKEKQAYYIVKNGKKIKKYKTVMVEHSKLAPNPEQYGVETYIWSNDRTENKADIISLETLEGEKDTLGIPEINSFEALMLSQAYAQKYFKQSFKLAHSVQEEMKQIGRNDLGVKQRNQKGIWVLQATAMPAILVEVGFLTNPDEELFIGSDEGQGLIAEAIARAVKHYVESN